MSYAQTRSGTGRLTSFILAAATVLLLSVSIAGCSMFGSGDLNPPQQAYALNKEYQVAARGALACLKVPACEKRIGDPIRTADALAFEYVESTTQQAKDWESSAEPETQAVEQSIFTTIFERASAAVKSLSTLLGSQ